MRGRSICPARTGEWCLGLLVAVNNASLTVAANGLDCI